MKRSVIIIAAWIGVVRVHAGEAWQEHAWNLTNLMTHARLELFSIASLNDKAFPAFRPTRSSQALASIALTHTNVQWRNLMSRDSRLHKESADDAGKMLKYIREQIATEQSIFDRLVGVPAKKRDNVVESAGHNLEVDTGFGREQPIVFQDSKSRKNYEKAMRRMADTEEAPAREAEAYAADAERHRRAAANAASAAEFAGSGRGDTTASAAYRAQMRDQAMREAAAARTAAQNAGMTANRSGDTYGANQSRIDTAEENARRAADAAARSARSIPP